MQETNHQNGLTSALRPFTINQSDGISLPFFADIGTLCARLFLERALLFYKRNGRKRNE